MISNIFFKYKYSAVIIPMKMSEEQIIKFNNSKLNYSVYTAGPWAFQICIQGKLSNCILFLSITFDILEYTNKGKEKICDLWVFYVQENFPEKRAIEKAKQRGGEGRVGGIFTGLASGQFWHKCIWFFFFYWMPSVIFFN